MTSTNSLNFQVDTNGETARPNHAKKKERVLVDLFLPF